MAQTKVRVLLNGNPLVGASIWLGEIGGQVKTSDADGEAAYPAIVPPFQGYIEVLILGTYYSSAKLLLIAGQTNIIDLGTISEP